MLIKATVPVLILSLFLPLLLVVGGVAGSACAEGSMSGPMNDTMDESGPSACCLQECDLRVSNLAAALNCAHVGIGRTPVLAKASPQVSTPFLVAVSLSPPGLLPPVQMFSLSWNIQTPIRYPEVPRYTLFLSLLI
jgi:hypothetical protein